MRLKILLVQSDFLKESLMYIRDKANKNLDDRTYAFPNSANIKEDWHINPTTPRFGGQAFELKNTNKLVAFVEFGTGMVGEDSHPLADELNYEYDVNNHGEEGWDFYNKKVGIHYVGFTGYEGKQFLYDAFFDYFHGDEWKPILKMVWERYMK